MSKSWLKFWTVDQFYAIDEQYRPSTGFQPKAAAVLVTVALALVAGRFFGQERTLNQYPALRQLFVGLPYPDLHPHLYWAAFKFVSYGLIPWLCLRFVVGAKLSEVGVRWVKEPRVWLLYAAMVAFVMPMVYAVSFSPAFLATYPKFRGAGNSLTELLLWEFAYGVQFLLLEFFLRGFMIFTLARYMGATAIFVMVVPYAMIHFGKPLAECLGSIITGVVLGVVALRTGSIWGGVVVHCTIGWGMDLFALAQGGRLAALFR